MTKVTCPSCHGYRIKEQVTNATINGKHIGELANMPMDELIDFFKKLADTHVKTVQGKAIKDEIIKKSEKSRLAGISYLSLNRSMTTLSGGEVQRLNLIFQIALLLLNPQ